MSNSVTYLGEIREITFSGQKPKSQTLKVTNKKIESTKEYEQSETGDLTATTTVTLRGDDTYRNGTITINWTGLIADNIETI